MTPKTPSQLLGDWLTTRDKAARVAVVIDSDRLLADAKVLDRSTLIDRGGREWQLAVFRGDDLGFRLRFRQAVAQSRTAIVLARGAESSQPIDVSFVADVLARNEAGDPLDLSITAFFRRIAPKINFPTNELRRFKNELLDRLEDVPQAAEKVIYRWGKPDSWGRGQVAAMVLLANRPELDLADIWPDEVAPADFLSHVLRLLVGLPELRPHREITRQIIREAARQQVQHLLFWTDADPEQLAAYLVLRDFAGHVGLQNPSTQLLGLRVFAPELPVAEMEPLAAEVIAALKKQPRMWAAVNQSADTFLTPKRVGRVLQLVPSAGAGHSDQRSLLKQDSPALLRQQVLGLIAQFFRRPSVQPSSSVSELEEHPLLQTAEPLSDGQRQCRHALQLLLRLHQLERLVAFEVPTFPHADALLDWYITKEQHLLELDLSRAYHHLEACGDDLILEDGQKYLFGGPDELRPTAASLKGRVLVRLRHLDDMLACFVKESPEQFGKGARSVRGLLRAKIRECREKGSKAGRVWVLIFDGMRFDSWQVVVKPLLAQYFEIQDGPYFCVLPSFTSYARAGLLAGALPTEWKGFKGGYTDNEQQLFAVLMGLTQSDAKSKLRFVSEADTAKARAKLAFTDKDAAPFNVLIYPVSDDACHDFGGDLASFNNKIQAEILGNKIDGVRGILDDLLKRLGPEDTVVLCSDHGFVELLPDDAVEVTESDASKAGRTVESAVRWRYINGFAPTSTAEAVAVSVGQHEIWMAQGRRWFSRKGGRESTRYTHGGLSLAEVVVPGAVLRRVTAKEARAELVDLPAVVLADEDAYVEMPVSVRNGGNCEVDVELRASNNLGEQLLLKRSRLTPGTQLTETVRVLAKYKETVDREPDANNTVTGVTIHLRHTDLQGAWRDALDGLATVPVKVKPKPVKLETDALKGFDDV